MISPEGRRAQRRARRPGTEAGDTDDGHRRPDPRQPREREEEHRPEGGTDRTRFNGLKHGLRAEQVVLPGESREEFEAEKQAWFDDWKPATHTRAVLVERAAVASWKLRRATRVEQARLYDVAADVAHDFDLTCKEVVEGGLHLLPRDPAAALSRLRSHAAGLDRLIGLWDELAAGRRVGLDLARRTTTTACSTCSATRPARSRRASEPPAPRSPCSAPTPRRPRRRPLLRGLCAERVGGAAAASGRGTGTRRRTART